MCINFVINRLNDVRERVTILHQLCAFRVAFSTRHNSKLVRPYNPEDLSSRLLKRKALTEYFEK
jgi:hypothetical protein